MRLTNNTIHSISKSSNIRMGLSYAKESHAEFFNRFSLCQDRIKDIFEIEKGISITEAQAVEGNIPVVAYPDRILLFSGYHSSTLKC